jgi:HEAT repeat protein
MKRNKISGILFSIALCLSINAQTTTNKSTSDIISDALEKLPAKEQNNYDRIIKVLCSTGDEGVDILVNMLHKPNQESNATIQYALSGMVNFASGDENLKNNIEKALLNQLDKISEKEHLDFIIRLISIVGSDASMEKLSRYLTNDYLSAAAAYTISSIGGSNAATTLKAALMRRDARSPESGRNIIQALGYVLPDGTTESFVKTFLNTDDPKTRAVVINTLGRIGTKASLNELMTEAEIHNYSYDKTNATGALINLIKRIKELGETKEALKIAEQLLKNATKAGETQTRIAALEILFESTPDKTKLLKDVLKDNDKNYRRAGLMITSSYAGKPMYNEIFKLLPKVQPAIKNDILLWIIAEAGNPQKKEDIKSLEIGVDKTSTSILTELLTYKDFEIIENAVWALNKIGDLPALSSICSLFDKEDQQYIDLAKQACATFEGSISKTIVSNINTASDKGKVAILELLAGRKANTYFNFVLDQTKSNIPEIKEAAFAALKDVVSEKDVTILCGMLEESTAQSDAQPLQQAISSALSTLPPAKQFDLVSQRMIQAGDAGNKLYLPVIITSGDTRALYLVLKAFKSETGISRNTAFEALLSWKGKEVLEPLYDICKDNSYNDYFEQAFNTYINVASGDSISGEEQFAFLQKAMDIARTDEQNKYLLKKIGNTGTLNALLYAGKFLDNDALKENAGQAVMKIALANKDFYGDNVKSLLEKTSGIINNPDAEYQRRAIKNFIDEMKK